MSRDDVQYEAALVAYCRYRTECEYYDRGLASAYFRHKDADTVSFAEREDEVRSRAFARSAQERHFAGFDAETLQAAKRETARWTHEKMLDYVTRAAPKETR